MVTKNRKEFRKIASACLSYAVLLLQSNAMEKMEEKAAKIQLQETLKIRVDNYYRAQRAWKELQNPELESRNGTSKLAQLVLASKRFEENSGTLKEKCEQENSNIQKFGETAVNVVGYLGEAIIGDKIKDPEAKSFFLGFLGSIKGQAFDLINKNNS